LRAAFRVDCDIVDISLTISCNRNDRVQDRRHDVRRVITVWPICVSQPWLRRIFRASFIGNRILAIRPVLWAT
jgi:hypothetical protein